MDCDASKVGRRYPSFSRPAVTTRKVTSFDPRWNCYHCVAFVGNNQLSSSTLRVQCQAHRCSLRCREKRTRLILDGSLDRFPPSRGMSLCRTSATLRAARVWSDELGTSTPRCPTGSTRIPLGSAPLKADTTPKMSNQKCFIPDNPRSKLCPDGKAALIRPVISVRTTPIFRFPDMDCRSGKPELLC